MPPIIISAGAALSGATEVRLFHGRLSAFPGEAVVATIGVDNLSAVPEPTSALLLTLGLGAFAWRGTFRACSRSR